MSKKLMVPGYKGTEDFEKSFISEGKYYCKYFKLDEYNKKINFEKGDLVIGYIKLIKDKIIIVKVTSNYTKNKKLNKIFLLFISEVASEFVERLQKYFCENDIILAKIIDSKDCKLSTVDDELGIINTHCKFCNKEIFKILPGNKCNNCKLENNKKFSASYNTLYS